MFACCYCKWRQLHPLNIHMNVRQPFINVNGKPAITYSCDEHIQWQSQTKVVASGVGGTCTCPPWKDLKKILPTTLMVQIKQFVRCVCVSVTLCLWVQLTAFELNDLCPRYLACWFALALSGSNLKVIHGHRLEFAVTQVKNVAKVVGSTSSEGFLVDWKK